jgi:hypothetical protein
MSPVAGHFDFPEYTIPLLPYKGQKREAKTKYKMCDVWLWYEDNSKFRL